MHCPNQWNLKPFSTLKKTQGISLIELLVLITIVSIIATASINSMRNDVAIESSNTAAQRFLQGYNYFIAQSQQRDQAIRAKDVSLYLCASDRSLPPDASDGGCLTTGTTMTNGWIIRMEQGDQKSLLLQEDGSMNYRIEVSHNSGVQLQATGRGTVATVGGTPPNTTLNYSFIPTNCPEGSMNVSRITLNNVFQITPNNVPRVPPSSPVIQKLPCPR